MTGKREVWRRFRKSVSGRAEVTSGGRLFQRRLPATGNARSPTVDSRVRRITRMTTTGDGGSWNRRRAGCSRTSCCQTMQASVNEHSQIDAFRRLRPVKVSQLRCDVLIPRRSMYQSGGGVEHRQSLLGSSGMSLQIDSDTVKASDHVRVLGVIFSSDLSLDKHVSSV